VFEDFIGLINTLELHDCNKMNAVTCGDNY